MKSEVSAGGIILRSKQKRWSVLCIKDMNDQWTFPKGIIEKKENPRTAAKREIREETGLSDITFVRKLPPIRYRFQRNGKTEKTVYYFLFLSGGGEQLVPQKEEGIGSIRWIPMDEIFSQIGYGDTNKPLLGLVETIILNKNL